MPKNVLGVVFFEPDSTPPSFFSNPSEGGERNRGKVQVQVVVTDESVGTLFAAVRFPENCPPPSGFSTLPVSAQLFQEVMGLPKVLTVFGVQKKFAGNGSAVHQTLEALLEILQTLERRASATLKRSLEVLEVLEDLTGAFWAFARLDDGRSVYLFFRDLGGISRGTSGWYVELKGASRINLYLSKDAWQHQGSLRPVLFGIPITEVIEAEI